MTVRHRDGIHFGPASSDGSTPSDGSIPPDDPTVVADARSATGRINVVSHAHADHTFRSAPETVVCSSETAAIAAARTGTAFDHVESVPEIDLVPAGHVVGSRAALIDLAAREGATAPDATPRRYCYTGDFSIRNRCYLEGFDPHAVDAAVLATEDGYHARPLKRSQTRLEELT